MIITKNCYEITIRLLETEGSETQDQLAQRFDDYCMPCIENGNAIKDLLTSFDSGEKP